MTLKGSAPYLYSAKLTPGTFIAEKLKSPGITNEVLFQDRIYFPYTYLFPDENRLLNTISRPNLTFY